MPLLLSRNFLFYLRMASSSSRVEKPPNILIFAPNSNRIRKSVISALATDKYVVYGISATDLMSAPWQYNTAALIVSAEQCDGNNMTRIMEFATDHGGKVIILGAYQHQPNQHDNILRLEDLCSLRDTLSSLSLSVAAEKCDTIEAPIVSDVHLICQGVSNFRNLEFEALTTLTDESAFDTELYFDRLSTTRLGRICIYASTASSTFDLLPKKAPLIDGTVAIADRQTKGKGRGGNVWLSPMGCAMFSAQLVIPVNSSVLGCRIPFLQHLAALAVIHGLSKNNEDNDIDLRLKWPNDIYLKTVTDGNLIKMGGVLAMSSFSGSEAVCNIGVGFNLDNESPTVSLNGLLKRNDKMRKEEYFTAVFNTFEELIDMMECGNEAKVYSLYYKYWLHSGQTVDVSTSSEDRFGAVVDSIDEFGFLRVRNIASDQIITVQDNGNSFDMMRGLIAPKLNK